MIFVQEFYSEMKMIFLHKIDYFLVGNILIESKNVAKFGINTYSNLGKYLSFSTKVRSQEHRTNHENLIYPLLAL